MEKIIIGKTNNSRRRRTNIINKNELADRKKKCMNALLNRPWISKEVDSQLYYWIKEQYDELRDWFRYYTGYSLTINRKIAKLDKAPVVAYAWMGFQEFRDPLDYALFTYSLWFLENKTERDQFLLTSLVKEVREYMVEQGLEVDWKNYFHRLSMARALKKLKNLDILQSVDGQEASWATNEEKNDVLYECNSSSRYVLRDFPRGLASYSSMIDMSETMNYGDDSEAINQRRRHHLYRRFLLEPIVLDEQWQDEHFYFHGQRKNLLSQLKLMFGWEGYRYREGIIFFEPELGGDAELFPTLSSISDLTMLVCGEIRNQILDANFGLKIEETGRVRLTKGEIERTLIKLKDEYGAYWINDYRKIKSDALAEEVCAHLVEWGFGNWEEDNSFFVLNAAAGRWTTRYGTTELDN